MKILLIRHGLPDEGNECRSCDTPLHRDGIAQADAVAAQLVSEGIDRIVSSPMRRAHQTAEPLAHALRLPIDTIEGWAEADRDHATTYRSRATLRSLGADTWNAFLQDPLRFLGVDPKSFRAGVLGALETVLAADSRCVAVFAHGLPINIVLSHVLGVERITHFELHCGSISRIQGKTLDALSVVSVNETLHLRSQTATGMPRRESRA